LKHDALEGLNHGCGDDGRRKDVVAGSELVFPVRRLAADGLEAWAQVLERGYEGHVAKDEASPYTGRADKGVAQGKGSGGLTWIIGSAACYGPSRRA
jgi:hypothetical protein